ncbi:TRAFAC clade GTPase domain-containing protein [Pedobacter arcticus]|uniref:TRAFAC clade GTPase domain-containing protein n=1 Tax=Pedobacter arcticus TaxID=752140 RepID=UPI0002ED0FDF|nr:hypothetical protein [Pedobacter arcticus]
MKQKSIILVGGPDSGKSNYLARLWLALESQNFDLISATTPNDIRYVESIAEHLLQGEFVPRTEPEEKNREFHVSVKSKDESLSADIVVPDILGEIWAKAVSTLEIPEKWLKTLKSADSAILFIRAHSENNITPLNWVTSQDYLKMGYGDKEKDDALPTQIVLMELLRFIDQNINRKSNPKPKVSIIITAWDLLDVEEAKKGPEEYLMNEFPLFAGRLSDIDSLEIKLFGSSIVGGDLKEDTFVNSFLEKGIDQTGYVVERDHNGNLKHNNDVCQPISWLLS